MSYIPYIPNVDHWRDHFSNNPQKTKSFYTLKDKHKGEGNLGIKLVTPTEQAVEQAKSFLKRKAEFKKPTKGPKKTVKKTKKNPKKKVKKTIKRNKKRRRTQSTRRGSKGRIARNRK
jgi:hypothetical protein